MLFRSNVVKTAITIKQLSEDLSQMQTMYKNQFEENANIVFKLNSLLEVARIEEVERTKVIKTLKKEFHDLQRKYDDIQRELKDDKEYVKENKELMCMNEEDILQHQLKIQELKIKLKESQVSIEDQIKKTHELELHKRLQREGLEQKKEVTMEGTLFYFVWDNPMAQGNNRTKSKARLGKNETENFDLIMPV